jgi:hypothetical protein
MCFPILAFTVAIRGQVEFGNTVRIFLVQEDSSQGLGFQWNRPASNQQDCTKSSIRYFLWEGGEESLNVDYCQCYDNGNVKGSVTGLCAVP